MNANLSHRSELSNLGKSSTNVLLVPELLKLVAIIFRPVRIFFRNDAQDIVVSASRHAAEFVLILFDKKN